MPTIDADAKAALVAAKPDFDRSWDRWQMNSDDPTAVADYRVARDRWVEVVLRDVFGWADLYLPADLAITNASVTSPDQSVVVEATGALRADDRVGALVWVIDPVEGLRDLTDDAWASSPIDRMELMLRASDIPIGVVTDGRWWGIVHAAKDTMAASGVVDAQTWVEDAPVRDAVVALLDVAHLLGGAEGERLPALFEQSVLAAEEITESLGIQVRKAVELVVQAFTESAAAARRRGDTDPLPDDGEEIYSAVVTVLMRVVFLLFAEERGLLPQGQLFEAGYGLTGQLDALDARARDEGEEALDGTHLTWHRLLATSQALYAGASFEDMRLPAYGGSLFDPFRFAFLTATTERGTLALQVSDRVMLTVLDAVQTAKVKGQDARRVTFRDIDVEQIGYIYEGLLGYTCRRSDEVIVGLIGGDGNEPEIPLDTLDDLYDEHGLDSKTAAAVIAWAKANQPAAKSPTPAALTKAFGAGDTIEDAERALLAVTADADLRDRLRPWVGAIRRDLRNRPVVILTGGLVVTETPSRRNAGAHYTPRALAEEVVHYALEPIVYAPGAHQTSDSTQWRLKSSTEILDLKVADIACGSGAFLVAAARYLAKRLVEAWREEGTTGFTPHELETKALREVVAHCLYGADINTMAVEMCKLSLWLVSLDRDLPFSFVDDKVFHGNSLLGLTSLSQLEALHINPPTKPLQTRFEFSGTHELVNRLDIDHKIAQAMRLRRDLASEIDERDPHRTAGAKRNKLEQLETLTRDLRKVADGVIAAGLALGGKPGRARDEAYESLRVAVGAANPRDPSAADAAMLDAMIRNGLTPDADTDYERWQPLHWAIEVPDVMEHGGFDAVVGNPPFLGGKKITPAVGSNMREWLVNVLAGGAKGNADLVAYFFLRAQTLLTETGSLGLIATNTLAQGDTREVGLDRMVAAGFIITRAVQSRRWPAKSANLEYAAVWGSFAKVVDESPRFSDDKPVAHISTLLEASGGAKGAPARLKENRELAFVGCNINGAGFTMSEPDALRMILRNERNRQVVRRYLGGEDLNEAPDLSASRWVVDFYGLTERQAAEFQLPFAWVSAHVRPYRLGLLKKPKLAERWWLYEAPAKALRAAAANSKECLAIALVSNTVMFARLGSDQVFSHKTAVVFSTTYADQGVLSSSIHRLWAVAQGSTMRKDTNYSPTDAFQTFPRPAPDAALERLGLALEHERREMMLRRELGLTKLYKFVNDPDVADSVDVDVARLRQIHVDLDQAVMEAYGWGDVPLDHGFHIYRQMTRWTVSPAARVEILDRLLEENHRRAALQSGLTPSAGEDELDDNEGDL
ncbi:MAG: N-6 DNA methylase [Humibacillus sp.]|nr:N-6 DNA methylase [Humibacillus sp.]MDN5775640.1 N-6 DNA methylase [Humibacillus sp.]